MTFIYPVQLTASWLGVTDPGTLVFAGRAAVAVLSTTIIPLTFYVGRANGGPSIGPIAGALVATSALLTEFAGTELPRPVSAVLVLISLHLATRQTATTALLSGSAAGLAATLRFSEVIFVVPLLLQLGIERRTRYLIPIHPFVALLAASGLCRCVTALRDRQQHLRVAMVGGLVAGSVVHLINGMHIRRSDAAVAMARWLTATDRSDRMLIEQGWRLGGKIHLGFDRDLIDADAGHLRIPGFLEDIVVRHQPARIAITHETCGETRCLATLSRLGYTSMAGEPVRSSGYVVFRRTP